MKPEATVRWLGVYFDRKLRFQKHTTILAARGESTVSSLTMLANTIRGLSQTHLRHLYLACVSPKSYMHGQSGGQDTSTRSNPSKKSRDMR